MYKSLSAAEAIPIFISYANAAEVAKNSFVASIWDPALTQVTRIDDDRQLAAGTGEGWEPQLMRMLQNARIVLLLVNDDFVRSRYCMETELPLAVERHLAGETFAMVVRLMENEILS